MTIKQNKMRNTLLYIGGGIAVIALYRYFSKQIKLASNWDWRIKNLQLVNVQKDKARLKGTITFVNVSNFNATINNYDITFLYGGVEIGRAEELVPFVVFPDSSFDIKIEGDVFFKNLGKAAIPFVADIVNKRPIVFEMQGDVSFTFAGITKNLSLTNQKVEYSENLAKEYGFEKAVDRYVAWIDNLVGIKPSTAEKK
jgi:hypothetical protein